MDLRKIDALVAEQRGHLDAQGYLAVWHKGRQIRQHRLVAEMMLGRPLRPEEVVHHKNGIRSDNRPENLEVLPSQSAHMREHMTTDEGRRRGERGNASRYGEYRYPVSITWSASKGRWIARKTIDGKRVWLGSFKSREEGLAALRAKGIDVEKKDPPARSP